VTAAETYAVMWRPNAAARWEVQPYLWPSAAAYKLCTRLVEEFGGEAFRAPIEPPTRLAVVREEAAKVSGLIDIEAHNEFTANGDLVRHTEIRYRTVYTPAAAVPRDLEQEP
jgi:hypothetical protein